MTASPLSVFCVGEAILDVTLDGTGGRRHPGGSPFNVAVAVARLGDAVMLRTALGDDAAGDVLRAHATESGVTLDPLSHTMPRTSRSTIRLNAARDAAYQFDLLWTVSPTPPAGAYDIVHTGSIAHTTMPGAEDLHALMRAMRGVALRSFDPNSRPSVTGLARDLAAFWRFAEESDIVKLSADDADWLFSGRDRTEVVAEIAERTGGLVVMTLGENGALLRSGAEVVGVPGVVVDVADTVGAGDAFTAALLHFVGPMLKAGVGAHSLSALQLSRVGELAVAYASASVTRSGANPPTRDEFESLAHHVDASASR